MENLSIPVESLYDKSLAARVGVNEDFIPQIPQHNFEHPEVIEIDDEILDLTGKIVEGHIQVETLFYSGDGSGTFHNFFIEVLKTSSGVLVATLVWEGGDTITTLSSVDGNVIEGDIDL